MENSKRKPLSDIANTYNLIPTSALRKLVSAASTSNSFSKPPISTSKSNSSSTNRRFFSESSSRSNTSIGSSNVGATLNSKKTVQFRSPPPSISSITSPGKQREIGKGITGNSSCSLEETNDGKEGILKHSRSSTVKINNIGQECLNPSGFVVERAKDKGKPRNTFNSSHVKTREKGKAVLQPSDIAEIIESAKEKGKPLNTFSSAHEKTREKGKVILQPSDVDIIESAKVKGKPLYTCNTSHVKTMEKGKENLQHSDIVEVAEHKGSSDAVAVKSRSPRRKSERRKFDAGASSCPPMMRPKSIKNDLDEGGDVKPSKSWTVPHPKRKKRTCLRTENTCELPLDFIEQQKAYFKEVDDFELLEEEATPGELD